MDTVFMTWEGEPKIEDLEKGLNKWISKIEFGGEKYKVNNLTGYNGEPNIGRLEVTYEKQRLLVINFYRHKIKTQNRKRGYCAMIHISLVDDGKTLKNPGEQLQLNVDDRLNVTYLGLQMKLPQALQFVIPIRQEKQVEQICKAFGAIPEQIKMDTYNKRYVIDTPIPELQWKEDPAPKDFYKYVSLDVFHKMLRKGTFRMNSIISQSDTQETFYIGDLVCSEYEDEFKRFRGMLAEQKTLISSFTTEYDDAYMWKEYGDNGQGVCLCFRLTGKKKLRQMKYVDEKTSPLMKYKKLVDELKEEGVHVHFNAIDDVHRFVKNDKYAIEDEWRLVIDYKGDVDYDLYGNRCVSYKDFEFEGRDIPEIGLHLDSIVIGPNQPEGTSNFPLLTERIYKRFGPEVMVNRSNCDKA